jgi:hypothetical protein
LTDWSTIASLATAGGTLVLAGATFSSVRAARAATRTTERALLAGIRPLLVPSRLEDPPEKVGFADNHWVRVPGGRGIAEASDEAIYLAIALRNAGTGVAVLDRWDFYGERPTGGDQGFRDPASFRRLTRDLYIPVGDRGFWQGAFREPSEPDFLEARKAIAGRQTMAVDLLYGDYEGGQRTISRFALVPADDGGWIVSVGRHWNLDRPDPR